MFQKHSYVEQQYFNATGLYKWLHFSCALWFTIPILISLLFAFQADLLFLSEVQVLHDITTLVSGY